MKAWREIKEIDTRRLCVAFTEKHSAQTAAANFIIKHSLIITVKSSRNRMDICFFSWSSNRNSKYNQILLDRPSGTLGLAVFHVSTCKAFDLFSARRCSNFSFPIITNATTHSADSRDSNRDAFWPTAELEIGSLQFECQLTAAYRTHVRKHARNSQLTALSTANKSVGFARLATRFALAACVAGTC